MSHDLTVTAHPLPRPATLAAVAAAALALDQATKWLRVAVVMQPPRTISVVPGVDLILGFNTGASFGMFGGVMVDRPLLMATLTGAVTLVFAILAIRGRLRMERIGLALVVGGALGNVADRLRQGAVTDFISLSWQDWRWPTFNVADIAITLGALGVLSTVLPLRRRKETSVDQS